MKLQTMLLPTGEFVLIASTQNLPSQDAIEGFIQFRKDSGAVAFLVINEDVEVENALVDENAVRADFWFQDDGDDGGPDGDDGERVDGEPELATVTYLPHASVTIESSLDNDALKRVVFGAQANPDTDWESLGTTDAGDEILAQRIDEGAGFSPAGLVQGGPKIDTMPELHRPFGEELREHGLVDSFTVQPASPDLLTLSHYFTSGMNGETEVQDALARLANPEEREMWAGPSCPCWPYGAAGLNGIARCGGCPEQEFDAPDPTAELA